MSIVNRTGFYTITPTADLETTAALISKVFEVNLMRDVSGRFEEYPAFVGSGKGVDFVLLGNPTPEDDLRENPTTDFELQVTILELDSAYFTTESVDKIVQSRLKNVGLGCLIDGWGT